MSRIWSICTLALVLALAACGGGGSGGDTPPANAAPVANAGVAQNVVAGTLVTLNGSASSDANSDPLTFAWTLTSKPAGSAAVLAGATSAAPTFTADAAGTYVASLVVNDGKISSTPSTVTVTATIGNAAPVANAGVAQNVIAGTVVTLNGSASTDANNDPLTYAWALTSKPAGSAATLAGASSAAPTFTADAAGTYVASLVVNDGKVNSAPATVTVTATVANAAPVANAGPAQNVTTGTLVTLNGSASSDANGDPLTYAWTLTSKPVGSAAVLAGATSAAPTFTADAAGTYVASLVVNDGKISSPRSTVTVTATVANAAPVIQGTVTDRASGLPLAGVSVNYLLNPYTGGAGSTVATTDASGRYSISGPQINDQTSGTISFTLPGYFAGSVAYNLAAIPTTYNVSLSYGGTILQGQVTNSTTSAGLGGANIVLTIGCSRGTGSACISPNDNYVRVTSGAGGAYSVDASKLLDPAVAGSLTSVTVAFIGAPGYFSNNGGASFSIAGPYPMVQNFALLSSTTTGNTAPVANAGTAQNVVTGAVVTLNGSASSDANGDTLTYSWTLTTKPAGSTAALSGATTAGPTFTADLSGNYVAALVVNDGKVNSAPSTVLVTAAAPNVAPIANAGPDQAGVTGTVVRLDGRASSDANGDPLTYFWVLAAPAGSIATLTNPTTATPSFAPDIVGIYAVGLVVSDGRLNSVADTAIISVGSPTVGPFSVSGTVFAANVSTVDSDTNDPNQLGRASNNSLFSAQPSGNPGLVVGYVNQPGTGPAGPNFAAGDTSDIFRADLVAGQVVELNFGDAASADLDIYVYDSLGNLAGFSTGTSRSECVLVRRGGVFYIEVSAFRGASTYELSWAAPRPSSTCPNVTPASANATAFVPGEVVGKPIPTPSGGTNATTQNYLRSAGVELKVPPAVNSPILMGLPSTRAQRAQTLRTLQTGDRKRALSVGNTTAPVHEAPSDVSDTTRLAFDTVVATKLLRDSGQFAYVDLNLVVEQAQVGYGTWPPNDADLSRQPHLGLIQLPQAFAALNSLSPRPTYTPIVAVVDTGVVADHPELQRMLVPGFDFVSNATSGGDGNGIDANPDDASQPGQNASFHGTHVAGTIAAETFNGAGVVGVAPMARIMPVRVLGITGSGSMYDILQGIRFAAGLSNDSGTIPAKRADVINLSLGGAGGCSASMADVIANARAQGSIVVAAAGNDMGAAVSMPANCPGAIAVSAIAYDGSLASYSNAGPQVAVTAPGGDSSKFTPAGRDEIWSLSATFVADALGVTTRRPSYRALQGTSMATPHVAGVLAIMRAVNPSLTPAAIDGLIAAGALTDDVGSPGRDNQFGYGRINALKAVLATGAAPAALPTLQLSPTTLDFGVTLTELNITATRLNGSTDAPIQYFRSSINPLAVQLFVPVSGNPIDGPYTYVVRVDRGLLAPSETVIRVDIVTQQGFSYSFDVVTAPRPVFATAQRGVGPLYVVAINADDPSIRTIAGVLAQSATPTYPYTMSGVNVPRVVIAAGTDLDNDGFICGPAEPCGAYPTLGSPTVLDMSANRAGINFSLSSGSTNGASASVGQVGQRGFARPR